MAKIESESSLNSEREGLVKETGLTGEGHATSHLDKRYCPPGELSFYRAAVRFMKNHEVPRTGLLFGHMYSKAKLASVQNL